MAKDFVLKWEGKKLLAITLEASERAVDETLQETALVMEADAPRDTGDLASSFLTEIKPRTGDNIEGRVGADSRVYYAAAVEVNHPSKAGFMRRAADREFPKLADRIGKGIK